MSIWSYIKNKIYHYYQNFLLYLMVFFGFLPSLNVDKIYGHLSDLVTSGKTKQAAAIVESLSDYQKRFLLLNNKGENLATLIRKIGSKELNELQPEVIPPEWGMHQLQFPVHPKYDGMNYRYIHYFQNNYLSSKSLSDRISALPDDMASDVKIVLTMMQNSMKHLYETRLKDNKVLSTKYGFYLEPDEEEAYYIKEVEKLDKNHSLIYFTGFSEILGHSASFVITRIGDDKYKLSVMERIGILHPLFDPKRIVPYIEVTKNDLPDIFKIAMKMQAAENSNDVYDMMFEGYRGKNPKIFGKTYQLDQSITDQPVADLELPNNSICGTTNTTYAYKAIFYNYMQKTGKYNKEQLDELYKYFQLSYLEAGVNFYKGHREESSLSEEDQEKILASAEIRLKLIAERLDTKKLGMDKSFEIAAKSSYYIGKMPKVERPISAREYLIDAKYREGEQKFGRK